MTMKNLSAEGIQLYLLIKSRRTWECLIPAFIHANQGTHQRNTFCRTESNDNRAPELIERSVPHSNLSAAVILTNPLVMAVKFMRRDL